MEMMIILTMAVAEMVARRGQKYSVFRVKTCRAFQIGMDVRGEWYGGIEGDS